MAPMTEWANMEVVDVDQKLEDEKMEQQESSSGNNNKSSLQGIFSAEDDTGDDDNPSTANKERRVSICYTMPEPRKASWKLRAQVWCYEKAIMAQIITMLCMEPIVNRLMGPDAHTETALADAAEALAETEAERRRRKSSNMSYRRQKPSADDPANKEEESTETASSEYGQTCQDKCPTQAESDKYRWKRSNMAYTKRKQPTPDRTYVEENVAR